MTIYGPNFRFYTRTLRTKSSSTEVRTNERSERKGRTNQKARKGRRRFDDEEEDEEEEKNRRRNERKSDVETDGKKESVWKWMLETDVLTAVLSYIHIDKDV